MTTIPNPSDAPLITAFLIRAQRDWETHQSDSLYDDLRDELATLLLDADLDEPVEDDDTYDELLDEGDYYGLATAILTEAGIEIP